MATSEQIRAALLAQKERGKTNNTGNKTRSTGDKAQYLHWDMPTGESVSVRFLPDLNPENTFFWTERQTIKLPFAGISGGEYDTTKTVEVTVPCADMFREKGIRCPIVAYTKPWWKDDAMKPLAQKYWKKRSYIFQGFVVKSPIVEEEPPENPIRRFTISPQVYEPINQSLLSAEMPEVPCDYVGGRDFVIRKTKTGDGRASYVTSGWSLAGPRSLSQSELEAIETYGLNDLSTYLGPVPDADHLAAIEAMFHASLNGDPFDVASFGQYYRAYAPRDGATQQREEPSYATSSASATPVAAPAPQAAPVAPVAPAAPIAAPSSPGGSPQEILQRIKARQAH